MIKLTESRAVEVAGVAWLEGEGIRGALALYGIDFDDVVEWSQVALNAAREVVIETDVEKFESRIVGAIAAAIIVGVELQRQGEL